MTSEIKVLYSKDRFDWDIIAEQTISVYSNTLAKHHSVIRNINCPGLISIFDRIINPKTEIPLK